MERGITMKLSIIISKNYPFAKNEVREIVKEVMPSKLKKEKGSLIIADTNKIKRMGHGVQLADKKGALTNEYIVLLSNLSSIRPILSHEFPLNNETDEKSLKQGYLPNRGFEGGRDVLSHVLAHELKHIEQFANKVKNGKAEKHITSAEKYANEVVAEMEADKYANDVIDRFRGKDRKRIWA